MSKLQKELDKLNTMDRGSVEIEYLYGSVAGFMVGGLTENEALIYYQKLKDKYFEEI